MESSESLCIIPTGAFVTNLSTNKLEAIDMFHREAIRGARKKSENSVSMMRLRMGAKEDGGLRRLNLSVLLYRLVWRIYPLSRTLHAHLFL